MKGHKKIGKKAVNRSITARRQSTRFYWMGNLISVMTQRTREESFYQSNHNLVLQHPFIEAYQTHTHIYICFCFGYWAMTEEASLSLSFNLSVTTLHAFCCVEIKTTFARILITVWGVTFTPKLSKILNDWASRKLHLIGSQRKENNNLEVVEGRVT